MVESLGGITLACNHTYFLSLHSYILVNTNCLDNAVLVVHHVRLLISIMVIIYSGHIVAAKQNVLLYSHRWIHIFMFLECLCGMVAGARQIGLNCWALGILLADLGDKMVWNADLQWLAIPASLIKINRFM